MRIVALPFLVTFALGVLCWIATGATLGLFFAGVVLIGILLPPLAARCDRPLASLLVAGAIIDAVAIVYLFALSRITLLQWLEAYAVLIAVAAALLGITLASRPLLGQAAAPAIVTLSFFAWLAWPIWLSPWAGQTLVNILSPAHPLLTLNRIFLDDFGPWTQQPLMYQLTTLGQDIAYALPRSIAACVFAHVIIALALALPVIRSAILPPRSARSSAS